MSFGDFMGLCAVMSALVAMVGILAGAYKRRLAFLERKLELAAGTLPVAEAKSELEKRVRVLERIATQGAQADDIALQIEALRAGEPPAIASGRPLEVTAQ
ncbi:hypothetical protein MTR62_14115 [Novosphingobium sp. 1949]|uniref:Uncharacterized protein n=1 Tax=Novosphingobium organovorum TaxID=2930092 RepID=A0ABT0BFL6_9SPHN|nr:hypothetical protein [Novosphingobium organovorum]MCJ2183819.1 hypothetical protein [Novosphingobium organovorum]